LGPRIAGYATGMMRGTFVRSALNATAALAAAAFLLTACGGSKDANTEPSTTPEVSTSVSLAPSTTQTG